MKSLKYLRIIFIVVIIIISVISVINTYEKRNFKLLTSKETLSEEDIIKTAEKIFKNLTTQTVKCNFEKYKEDGQFAGNAWNDRHKHMNDGDFYLYIKNSGTLFTNKKSKEPLEITAIFECFIYLKDKQLQHNLFGIYTNFSTGGVDNVLFHPALIMKSEFEELYNNTDMEGLTKRQSAQKLAEIWIENNGYVKDGWRYKDNNGWDFWNSGSIEYDVFIDTKMGLISDIIPEINTIAMESDSDIVLWEVLLTFDGNGQIDDIVGEINFTYGKYTGTKKKKEVKIYTYCYDMKNKKVYKEINKNGYSTQLKYKNESVNIELLNLSPTELVNRFINNDEFISKKGKCENLKIEIKLSSNKITAKLYNQPYEKPIFIYEEQLET